MSVLPVDTMRPTVAYQVLLLLGIVAAGTAFGGGKAVQLVEFDKETGRPQAREEALKELEQLPTNTPVRVISAIGDARVGKSTTLNNVISEWQGASITSTQVFKTSREFRACTKGIWMYIHLDEKTQRYYMFLDVEGNDLGSDQQTQVLSIITGLVSSEIMLFATNKISNHGLHFMYQMCRVRDEYFHGDGANTFGNLHCVIRGQLDSKESLQQYVRNFLMTEQGDSHDLDKERQQVYNHFADKTISGTQLPEINHDLLDSHVDWHNDIRYHQAIETLLVKLKKVPPKATMKGADMDGKLIADLIRSLVNTPHEKWASEYTRVEREFCRRVYVEEIDPLLEEAPKWTASELEVQAKKRVDRYKQACRLDEEVEHARQRLQQKVQSKAHEETERNKLAAAKEARDKAVKDATVAQEELEKEQQRHKETKEKLERNLEHQDGRDDDDGLFEAIGEMLDDIFDF